MQFTLKDTDLVDAENFLTEYLSEQVPEANFQIGSAVRDLVVRAFTPLYAFLRSTADKQALMQSLTRIQTEMANSDTSKLNSTEVVQAVDQLMANWFITRKGGQQARMTATLHFTQRAAVAIRNDARFWRTPTLAFYPDITSTVFMISENQMRPVFDTRGRLVDYVASVPLVASRTGDTYNLSPGRFVRVDVSGGLPYFSYAEQLTTISDGTTSETTEDLIKRAPTAISVRNLVNNRSIDATILEQFTTVKSTFTVGMGESEMIRDRLPLSFFGMELHTGGYHDTYIDMPVTTVEETGMLGGYFPRPDGIVSVFRDPALTRDIPGAKFTELGVQPGHVLFISSGIVGAPRAFPITEVTAHELFVSERSPFGEASDELDVNEVSYSIGWLAPAFQDIDFDPAPTTHEYERVAAPSTDPLYSFIPAGTSRHISEPGCMVLTGRPVLDVLTVEVTDPVPSDARLDPSTGTVKFMIRTNMPPVRGSAVGTSQYQVQVLNPASAQSSESVTLINVGYPDPEFPTTIAYDGKNLRVSYLTLQDFAAVASYARDYNNRVLDSNHLIRARNPVWVSMNIPYRYKPTALTTIDTAEAAARVAAHIDVFDPNDDLDMSDIATLIRDAYADNVGTVFPFVISYDLDLPDGQVLQFETTDIVSIFTNGTAGVTLINGDDVVVPQALIDQGIVAITGANVHNLYAYYGISDRTVVYKSREDLITLTLRG